jgi:beta-lactamase class A
LLPSGTRVAHKDGSVSDARTDAGILFTPDGAIVVCVLTAENADRRWARDNAGNLLCAKVAKEVYDHFNAPKKGN